MFVRFGVNGDQIRPGFHKIGNEGGNRFNHQMHVEYFFRSGTDGFDDGRAESDVGNEMTVHHVDVDVIGSRLVNGGDFLPQF